MKIFLILSFLSQLSLAQSIPPKAHTIIIKNLSFNEICMRLLDSGYSIEKKDNDLQTVRTESRMYPRYWNASYKISLRVKDSTAYFTGTFTSPAGDPLNLTKGADPLFKDDPFYNHTNKKGATYPKSLTGYPFLLMDKFAQSFKKPVEYLTTQ